MEKEVLQSRISEIVNLQDMFNKKTNGEDWLLGVADNGRGIDWDAAIFMETAELIDSIDSWKHWKDTNNYSYDVANMKIELVDILHFIISDMLAVFYNEEPETYKSKTVDILTEVFANTGDVWDEDSDLPVDDKLLTSVIVSIFKSIAAPTPETSRLSSFYYSFRLIDHLSQRSGGSFTFEEMLNLYIVKNALNAVRQDNGYSDGRYIKMWDGVEDNIVATSLVNDSATYETAVEVIGNYYINNILGENNE